MFCIICNTRRERNYLADIYVYVCECVHIDRRANVNNNEGKLTEGSLRIRVSRN